MCSPSRGLEKITKTFQHGARAGGQRGSPKPLVTPGHMTTPWSCPVPFIPSGPQHSAFSSFSRSTGSGLRELTKKLIKRRQKQGVENLLPAESWWEEGASAAEARISH